MRLAAQLDLMGKGRGHGVANAGAAIFLLRWRHAARGLVHPGCVVSETSDRGEGAPQFADHSHTFRSEMAGARRIRYQPAGYRSGVDRERGSDRARPRGDWRRAGQHESTRDFCDGVCRPTAGSQGESARTEAGTPE